MCGRDATLDGIERVTAYLQRPLADVSAWFRAEAASGLFLDHLQTVRGRALRPPPRVGGAGRGIGDAGRARGNGGAGDGAGDVPVVHAAGGILPQPDAGRRTPPDTKGIASPSSREDGML
jgi:hypothetical protein